MRAPRSERDRGSDEQAGQYASNHYVQVTKGGMVGHPMLSARRTRAAPQTGDAARG